MKIFTASNFHIFFFCLSGVEPDKDEDFIFEDFARLRLKGHDPDDTEA